MTDDTAAETTARRSITLRLYDALGVHPALGGVYLAIAWLVLFVGAEWISGRLLGPAETDEGYFIELLIAGFLGVLLLYITAAYATLDRRTKLTIAQLKLVPHMPRDKLADLELAAGVYPRASFWTFCAVGVLLSMAAPYLEVPRSMIEYAPYDISRWSPETLFHRTITPFIGLWLSRLVYAIIVESMRLRRFALSIERIDLVNFGNLMPFAAQGLTNAAIAAGFASFFALFLIDVRYSFLVIVIVIYMAIGAGLGLLLPLTGVRARIRKQKEEEIAWCRYHLNEARSQLKGGSGPTSGKVADLISYLRYVESVPDWPLSGGAILRFGFYLLIPVLSWSGGALVERAINAVLD